MKTEIVDRVFKLVSMKLAEGQLDEARLRRFIERHGKKLKTLTAAAVLAGSVGRQEPGDPVRPEPSRSDTEQPQTPRPIKTLRK